MAELEPVRAPFAAHIGGVMKEAGEGWIRLLVQTTSAHADPFGHVHKGVLTALMDSTIGIALGRMRGEEQARQRPHATIDMSASFLADALAGDLVLTEGRITRLGERIAFGEAEARLAEGGELLARASLTFAISAGAR
jgi:uncharacterized protein (TIGR00369 family)